MWQTHLRGETVMAQHIVIGFPDLDAAWIEIIDGKVIVHPGNQLRPFALKDLSSAEELRGVRKPQNKTTNNEKWQVKARRMLRSMEKMLPDRREVASGIIQELEKRKLITAGESASLIGILEAVLTEGESDTKVIKRVTESAHRLLKKDPDPIAAAIAKAMIDAGQYVPFGEHPIDNVGNPKGTRPNVFSDVPDHPDPGATGLYGAFLGAVIGGLLAGPPGAVVGAALGLLSGAAVSDINQEADQENTQQETHQGEAGSDPA
jgi:hypothetical protein